MQTMHSNWFYEFDLDNKPLQLTFQSSILFPASYVYHLQYIRLAHPLHPTRSALICYLHLFSLLFSLIHSDPIYELRSRLFALNLAQVVFQFDLIYAEGSQTYNYLINKLLTNQNRLQGCGCAKTNYSN